MSRNRSIAFVLAALLLAGCASDPQRDTALSHEGQEALLAGDLKTAEERLQEALDANPDNPHALTDLSTVYIKQSRYDQAKPLCERVIAHADEYENAATSAEASQEMARVVQTARDNLAVAEKGIAEEEALLALQPDGAAPTSAPLVRETAATPTPQPAVTPATQPAVTTAAAPQATPNPAPATVTAAAATTQKDPATVQPPANTGFRYRIQVGAFKSRGNAERLMQRINQRHADALHEKEVRLIQAGGFSKVQIGPYATFAEATAACRTFGQEGARCFPKGHD